MRLESMMSDAYPDAIGVTIKGPEVKLNAMVSDHTALMTSKGYTLYSFSAIHSGERSLVYLNREDTIKAREVHNNSCRNSLGGLSLEYQLRE